MSNIGKYAFLGGVVLAIVMAFVSIPSGALILAVLGLVVGFLNITSSESQGFLVAAMALMLTATSAGIIPEVGGAITAVTVNLVAFVAPAALLVALKSLTDSSRD